jgi:nitrate reductase NapE component
MADLTTPLDRPRPVRLKAKDVDKETQALYRRLFTRSVVAAGLVFALVDVVDSALPGGAGLGVTLALLSLPVTFVGYALVEGMLVQVVRDLHEDGDHRTSLAGTFRSAFARLRPLVAVSLITGFGVLVGMFCLLIPGLVLLTRWAVAVPVVMIEGRSAREALARSQQLVRGNNRAVFNVMITVGILTGIVRVLFSVLGRGHGFAGLWLSSTLAATLTVPYAAHAVTVLYYRLIEPERPVALEPGKRWHSIWDAERAQAAHAEQ